MFNKEFFPTPKSLAHELAREALTYLAQRWIDGDAPQRFKVLDPSAGKGDLLEGIKEVSEDRSFAKDIFNALGHDDRFIPKFKLDFYAIEMEPELQSILHSKKIKVVDSNFLGYSSPRNYDVIIMNPPFSVGAQHLLKAWNQSKGGIIIAQLNAETLRNPYTRERSLLSTIIETHGFVEYRQELYSKAEKQSDVEVAIVRLMKPMESSSDFEFDGTRLNVDSKIDDSVFSNQLARRDALENWFIALERGEEVLKELMLKQKEFSHYANIISNGVYMKDDMKMLESFSKSIAINDDTYASVVEQMHKISWLSVFKATKVASIMTEGVRKQFENETDRLGCLSFSRENVERILDGLFRSSQSILDSCVLEAFEYLTKYHEENRVHHEGWLTNDAYKVNKRCIIPFAIETYLAKYGDWNLRYEERSKLDDLEKALAFLDGQKGTSDLVNKLQSAIKDGLFGAWHDSKYFRFKFHKKGTVHLEFKDRQLFEFFNEKAAKGKNWLPKEARKSKHRFNDDAA